MRLAYHGDDPRRAAAWRPGAGSGASANSSSREYIRYVRRISELDRLVGYDDAGFGGCVIVEDGDSGMAAGAVNKDVKSRWGRSKLEVLLYKRMGGNGVGLPVHLSIKGTLPAWIEASDCEWTKR